MNIAYLLALNLTAFIYIYIYIYKYKENFVILQGGSLHLQIF